MHRAHRRVDAVGELDVVMIGGGHALLTRSGPPTSLARSRRQRSAGNPGGVSPFGTATDRFRDLRPVAGISARDERTS